MKISSFVVGELQENCYLLVDEDTRGAVLIDPGAEGDRLVSAVRASGASLEAIWVTHGHMDHIGGIAAVKRVWDVPIHLHPLDAGLYENAARAALVYGLRFETAPPADRALADGDVLSLGALRFQVMHAPGHAPGHVVLHGHGVAFVGDCLFAGSVGRTDLPFSNPADLTVSLEKIAALPGETAVYAGHGPATTIERELRTNPFLNGAARVIRG
jgi:hydroxyacylglutathione hydrolase